MPHIKRLNASKVAEYFIWKAGSESKRITNKKLQKLLYYAQAWSLVVRDKKLFSEKIEAWVHGPAIRSIYVQYRKFGFDPITERVAEEDIDGIPTDIRRFLDQVWNAYGKYDAAYLEHLTHSEEPWQKAREGLEADAGSDNAISIESMKVFYSARLEAARSFGT